MRLWRLSSAIASGVRDASRDSIWACTLFLTVIKISDSHRPLRPLRWGLSVRATHPQTTCSRSAFHNHVFGTDKASVRGCVRSATYTHVLRQVFGTPRNGSGSVTSVTSVTSHHA